MKLIRHQIQPVHIYTYKLVCFQCSCSEDYAIIDSYKAEEKLKNQSGWKLLDTGAWLCKNCGRIK